MAVFKIPNPQWDGFTPEEEYLPISQIGVQQFPDAPKDGKMYNRKNGNWVECPAHPIPTLEAVPGEDTLTYVEEGVTYIFRIGDEARYYDSEKEEYVFYKLYDLADNKANWKIAGSGGVFNETLVLSLTSNQGSDTSLEGVKINIKYSDNTTVLTWSGVPVTTTIPMNTTYTIICEEISGYASPPTQEFIALAGNTRNIDLIYNTTITTINVSSNQAQPDSALNGLELTLSYNNIPQKLVWNNLPITVKIPTGIEYTLSGADIIGYKTPTVLSKIAEGTTGSSSLVYNTTVTSISLTSNQPAPDANLNSAKFTLAYPEFSEELTYTGSPVVKNIPTGVQYTITGKDIAGYKSPAALTKIAAGVAETASINYLTEKVTINVVTTENTLTSTVTVAITGGSTNNYTIASGSNEVIYIPHGKAYTISCNEVDMFIKPSNQSYTASDVSRSVTLTYTFLSEQAYTTKVTFVDSEGAPAVATANNLDIASNLSKGKRCLVKKTSNGVAICYLSETNSEKFHDNTTVAKLNGTMGQWMTDSPSLFIKVDESISGTHNLLISDRNIDGTYKEMRRVLIGVTKGISTNSKLWSKKGSAPTTNQTAGTYHTQATACGNGFDIIDYETHRKLAYLFYAKYGNRNPQAMDKFGSGSSTTGRTSGETSTLGNADGKTTNQVAFHGVEDPYGNVYEWMSGIHSNGLTYYIYDGFEPDKVPTAKYRTVTVPSNASGWISKLKWGEYGDMIPIEFSGSETTHYCDNGNVGYSGWRAVRRSFNGAGGYGGFASFYGSYASSLSASGVGSRLQYRGNIQVIENPAEFIALPVGF